MVVINKQLNSTNKNYCKEKKLLRNYKLLSNCYKLLPMYKLSKYKLLLMYIFRKKWNQVHFRKNLGEKN